MYNRRQAHCPPHNEGKIGDEKNLPLALFSSGQELLSQSCALRTPPQPYPPSGGRPDRGGSGSPRSFSGKMEIYSDLGLTPRISRRKQKVVAVCSRAGWLPKALADSVKCNPQRGRGACLCIYMCECAWAEMCTLVRKCLSTELLWFLKCSMCFLLSERQLSVSV